MEEKICFQSLLLAQLDPPKEQIRDSIDPNYIRELADSIRTQGLLQPIVVRPTNGRFEIIAGHCRFLAISLLGLTHVSCHIIQADDTQTALARAMENLQRFDMTPIEEAKCYKSLHDKFNMPYETIAEKTGKSPGLIKQRIDLLKMHPKIVAAVHEKKISVSVAQVLCQVSDEPTMLYYLDIAIENGITRDVASMWLKEWRDLLRRQNTESIPLDTLPDPMLEKPIYLACDGCHDSVELSKLRRVCLCSNCNSALSAIKRHKTA